MRTYNQPSNIEALQRMKQRVVNYRSKFESNGVVEFVKTIPSDLDVIDYKIDEELSSTVRRTRELQK
jgi:hypothetical protein